MKVATISHAPAPARPVQQGPLLRLADNTTLARSVRLPDIPGSVAQRLTVFDRIGGVVRAIGDPVARRAAPETTAPPTRPLAAPAEPPAPERMRVMSYNIRGGQGPTGTHQPSSAQVDRLAEAIRAAHPDVVLLQEIDDFAARSKWMDNLNQLVRRTGASGGVAGAPVRNVTGRTQSVAVLTFGDFRLEDARNIRIDDAFGEGTVRRVAGFAGSVLDLVGIKSRSPLFRSYMPRNAVEALVRTPAGAVVRAMTTHVTGHMTRDAVNTHAAQLAPIAGALAAWTGPTLLGGDFNIRSGRAAYRVERGALSRAAGLTDAFTAIGVPPGDPARISNPSGADIDRFWASPHFRVLDTHVDREHANASDHHPVVLDVELQPGA